MKLLTIENAKTKKGESIQYLTGILYLAPHHIAGYGSVCPWSTQGCRKACLYSAGRGAFTNVQEARILKTIQFFENRQGFIDQLREDIKALVRKAAKLGMRPTVRLNGTSDLPWHRIAPSLFTDFPEVQFYDYTKDYSRVSPFDNYDITYSASENTTEFQIQAMQNRVAVVFDKELPSMFAGKPVVNGDETDLRFLDPQGVVIGLKAKGKAKRDEDGFVYGKA